jgi:hypothetical protein
MRNPRILLVAALGVLLSGSLPTDARAQLAFDTGARIAPSWPGRRPALEGFYSQQRFDGAGAPRADGLGAKLMWNPALTADPSNASWLARHTAVGLYGVYTPERELGFSTVHGGVVADVRPLAGLVAGRVEPFVSLGAGALRTNVRDDAATRRTAPSPLLAKSVTTATLMPGIGARVMLTPGVALQGDLRDVMTFRAGTQHNTAFGVGLRLAF